MSPLYAQLLLNVHIMNMKDMLFSPLVGVSQEMTPGAQYVYST